MNLLKFANDAAAISTALETAAQVLSRERGPTGGDKGYRSGANTGAS